MGVRKLLSSEFGKRSKLRSFNPEVKKLLGSKIKNQQTRGEIEEDGFQIQHKEGFAPKKPKNSEDLREVL